jgi:hypothetical protein
MSAPESLCPTVASVAGSEPLHLAPPLRDDAVRTQETFMTRTLLLLSLCLMLAGCSSDDGTSPAEDAAATSTVDSAAESTDSAAESTDSASDPAEDAAATADPIEDVDEAPEPEPEPPACNPISNTGCEEGQKCGYGTTGEKLCVPAGDTPGGDPCQSDAECAGGSTCTSLNGEDYFCYIFCKTIGHCPNNAACMEISDTAFNLCKIEGIYDTCDILAQDCEQGKGCYSIGGEDLPVCLDAGTEPVGGACETPSDCSPGHHCVNFRCYEVCDKNDANACGTFVSCAGFVASGAGYCDEQQ